MSAARQPVAVAFPGMGTAEFAGVSRFMLADRTARSLLAEAGDVLGYSVFDRYRDAITPYSEAAQVAFLVNCVALARWARDELGVDPALYAAASFGGKAAAVSADALGFADAVRLTAGMVRCEESWFADRDGDVLTLSFVRVPRTVVHGMIDELNRRGGGEISCYVDEDLHMVTLREADLDWMRDAVRAAGGMTLAMMRPPMHAALLAPLRDRVAAEVVAGTRFAAPRVPIVADRDGVPVDTADGVRAMLLDGYVCPVRWPDVVATLVARGIEDLYMCGQDALFGRVRGTTSALRVTAVGPAFALRPRARPAAAPA